MGFDPLDELGGIVGGDRHGIWDYTWVAHRRFAPLAYASLYVWDGPNKTHSAQVWARLEGGHMDERSLLRHLDRLRDPPSANVHAQLVGALYGAAHRALRMTEQRPPPYVDEEMMAELRYAWRGAPKVAGLEPRLPYRRVVDLVERILASDPDRVWTNQEVLRALLERGHTTDRADVNSALSDLASSGRIERVARGKYTIRGFPAR
jgi:hypothetical protein